MKGSDSKCKNGDWMRWMNEKQQNYWKAVRNQGQLERHTQESDDFFKSLSFSRKPANREHGLAFQSYGSISGVANKLSDKILTYYFKITLNATHKMKRYNFTVIYCRLNFIQVGENNTLCAKNPLLCSGECRHCHHWAACIFGQSITEVCSMYILHPHNNSPSAFPVDCRCTLLFAAAVEKKKTYFSSF